MDWQTPEDTVPSTFITEANARSVLGKPPATGAWREGDPVGDRRFASLGAMTLERGGELPVVRVAYETWGTLNADRSNALLIVHALTGDSHVIGSPGPGHPTGGWWSGIVGPGKAIDTDRWYVVAPNMLGGCQGTTGPASSAPDGQEWGSRFPFVTIRDQVEVQRALTDTLGIDRWAAVIGGSMGGMQSLEWAISHPDRLDRVAVLAAPARSSRSGWLIAHSSDCIPPIDPPITAAQRSMPRVSVRARCTSTWSRIVTNGKREPHSWPSGAEEAGPVVPWQPPSMFGATTYQRSVSIALPGPTIPDHQPPVGCPGPGEPITWLSPVRACTMRRAFDRSALRVPQVS
eukprot:TRINITY_DN29522_c0_g1_i1.p1 TRINITY_DN29522_c0_g1~~TRINITY_DN29522_c0_g1_i1.p1  ORF type:complete len:346 (+),score=10.01 TRINITY_DN29522_c0_g1_i1:188-1225(+)